MAEIDRRVLLRGMLFSAAFVTTGGVAITSPEVAKAIPLAADKKGPIETDDLVQHQRPIETDDLVEEQGDVELVQYYWRRRRRRWWRRRRRCWWRRGRLVCVRRW
jgi:hypothetical protein